MRFADAQAEKRPVSAALIVRHETLRKGPIPIALAYGGLEVCEVSTAEEADGALEKHGPEYCVLLVHARALAADAGDVTWSEFLSNRPGVAAVVVAYEEAASETRAVCEGSNRILLERPFDAAAIVAAVRRTAEVRRPPLRRVPARLAETA